jgi:AraC-like DNA-binding protein
MFIDILFIVVFHSFDIYPKIIVNVINIMVFLLIVLIMFKGLNKPEIFITLSENRPVKYAGSNLKEADRLNIRNKLEQMIQKEKRYNDPDINIKDLADEMNVLPKHLSQVINEDFQQNFFDYINRFRIEEAKDLLINYPSSAINVLEILYKTGFNSKTSFNLAFKKNTGYTPTSYRRLHSKAKDRVKSVHF